MKNKLVHFELRVRCPHCGGSLVTNFRALSETEFDCVKCDRGWEVVGSIWISHGDTQVNVYRRKNKRWLSVGWFKRTDKNMKALREGYAKDLKKWMSQNIFVERLK